jgi:tRNA pseudouridine38-40 synthase
MRTIALTLAYDGTQYVGWQRQPAGVSIQSLIEASLLAIEGRPVTVTGAGRTDAGVHAIGQTASFALEHGIALDALVRALNARLPPDVRALAAVEKGPAFNARFSAVSKTYQYLVSTGPIADPFDRLHAWHVPRALDLEALADAVGRVAGTHDFAAFQAAGSDVSTTIRTVARAECAILRARAGPGWRPVATPGDRVVITLAGDGFLRHMVRNIVGTAVDVAVGRRPADDVTRVLAGRDRREAGPTAPAHGLCLVRVDYPPDGANSPRGPDTPEARFA